MVIVSYTHSSSVTQNYEFKCGFIKGKPITILIIHGKDQTFKQN